MALIGPFFYIDNELIYNACPLSRGRRQADKLDYSYSHEKLWDDNFVFGEYIDYPRGRVVWDCTNNRAIIYIDRCINTPEVIEKIKSAFELQYYTIDFDSHYSCRDCVGDVVANCYTKKGKLMNTLKTGIKALDKKHNGGLRNGSLTVIAGRPAMGKSSLAFQIAGNIAKSGKRVLLVNLETSEKGVRDRMSKQGFESSEDNLIVCDEPNISVGFLTQKVTSAEKVDVIFIDYIQLMQGERSEVIRGLKRLAEKMNVPIVVVSMLGRDADGVTDTLPLMESVRKAGFREQDADIIIFLHRDSYYAKSADDPENDLLILGENKYGETAIIPVHWNKEKMIFEDIQ